MKIRGWVFLGIMLLSAQWAMAASDASNIATGGDDAAIAGIVATTGIDEAIARTQLVESSRGTLLDAFADVNSNAATDVKNAVNTLIGEATTAGGNTIGALSILSGTAATAATTAGGATTAAIGGGGGVIASRQGGLMAERKALGNVDSALASFKMNQNFANRLWASPFYTRQNMDEKDGYSGYNYSAYGATLGYDRVFGSVIVGGAFTYSRGDFDADNINDDNTTDNYGFSLYGQYYNCNGFFATLAGGYNYGDNEMRATVGTTTITGDNSTNSYWLGANVGKDFFIGENWTVTPSVGLFWSESEGSAYTNRANGAAFQDIGKVKSESVMLPIDLKVAYTTRLDDCSTLSFNVAGGYAYDLKSDGGRAEGSFNYVGTAENVFIQGVKPGRSSWNLGTGVTYRRNNFDIGVNYRYDGKKKFDGHRVAATIGWNF